jgi:predicted nucleic-acid-binding protein
VIALDTHVVVRILVRDDPDQVARVEELLRRARADGELCLITDPVLCEIEGVLSSVYGASRVDLVAAFQEILAEPLFEVEDRDRFRRAIERYEQGAAELSDYLIGLRATNLGASTTYTFDRALLREDGFSRP